MLPAVTYAFESPDQPEIVALIEALDHFQDGLYPADSNHFLDIKSLASPSVLFLVARQNGKAVGCGAVKIDPRGWGEIKRMYVDPALRGQRIGAEILGRLEKAARKKDIALLRLETGIHSHEALRAYERANFRKCANFGDYAPDPLSVFMEKMLTAP
jgi:putative acetyltransferase